MKLGSLWKDVSIAKKLYFVVGIMAFLAEGDGAIDERSRRSVGRSWYAVAWCERA